jgi:hypothetical protein
MSSKPTTMATEAPPSKSTTGADGIQQRLASAAIWTASVGVAVVLLLPLHAAWWLEPTGPLVFALGVGLAALSVFSPTSGLAALILLLPLSAVVEQLLHGVPAAGDVVDMLVLAFAAGASLRLWHGGRRLPGRLTAPAALLAVAIVTSTLAEVRALQSITPGQSILPDIWSYVTSGYWTERREFQGVRHTFRWLAWLIIAVHAERIVAVGPGLTARGLLPVWFGAGLTGALIVVHRMFDIVLSRDDTFVGGMADLWRHTRLSVLQPDVNAAGSYLLLFLVPAVVTGFGQHRRWLLGVCLPPLVVAFALARSRAAIAAAVVVLCAAGILYLRRTRPGRLPAIRRLVLPAVVVVFGLSAMAATYYATAASHAAIGDAARVRLELLSSGFEALKRSPVFGVGLSDYIHATRRFVTPDMTLLRATAPAGENAHNNLLQIAVELGAPACVIFLWLIWRAIRPALTSESRPIVQGMALGIVAFLLSALFGHPLLVPLVGTAFFVALGLTAGGAGPPRPWPAAETVCWLVAGLYLGSLSWRW